MDSDTDLRVTSALRVLAFDLGTDGGVRVTRIVAIEIEPTDDFGPEPWAVEWTNDLGEFRHVHYAKKAAQRHVANMLKLLQRSPPPNRHSWNSSTASHQTDGHRATHYQPIASTQPEQGNASPNKSAPKNPRPRIPIL